MAISIRHVLTEFICTFWFIFFSIGYVVTNTFLVEDKWSRPSDTSIAAVFAFTITALVYAAGGISGGQLNPAVTSALMITKHVDLVQGLLNIVAQFLASIFASLIIYGMTQDSFPDRMAGTVNYAPQELTIDFHGAEIPIIPKESVKYNLAKVFFFEVFATFFLMYVIYQTAIDKVSMARSESHTSPIMAPIAIGSAVFVGLMLLIPVDKGSLNPARSLGPFIITAIVRSTFEKVADEASQAVIDAGQKQVGVQQLVYIFAPLIGAVIAAGVFYLEAFIASKEEKTTAIEDAATEEPVNQLAV